MTNLQQQMRRYTAEDLYRAQCRRDGRDPIGFDRLPEYVQEKYRDRVTSCHTTVLESWEGDHTDLVHVLWDHGIKGEDADRLASSIMRSGYADARRAHEQIEMLDRVEAVIANGATAAEAIAILRHLMIHAEPIGEARLAETTQSTSQSNGAPR